MVDLLTEQVDATRDDKAQQGGSEIIGLGAGYYLQKAGWSVAFAMAKDGQTTDLDVGTYYLNYVADRSNPNAEDNLCLPDNAIIIEEPIRQVTEAKVGSGTITPSIGAVGLTAVTSAGVAQESSKMNPVAQLSVDNDWSVAVASAVVTAGAFVYYIRYYLGV